MTVTVVTGFSPKGLEEYGWNFIKGFCAYWPVEVNLVMYLESHKPDIRFSPIDRFVNGKRRKVDLKMMYEVEGCVEFIERHWEDPKANGTDVQPNWKEREREEGYNFKWDAVKWCRMAMFTGDASLHIDQNKDILVWLDGDVMTRRAIPQGFVEGLVGNYDVTYLGREPKHPDTAFVAFQSLNGLRIARLWGAMYHEDAVFRLPETHSAYVFKHCMNDYATNFPTLLQNLTPKGRGHVWYQSPLADYMDHLKGQKRKKRGRSKEWK